MPPFPRSVLAAALLVGLTTAARPADAVKTMAPAELDQALLAEVKAGSEVAKNLQHLSDVIGPRLTGSKQLERANNWTAEMMKKYGLDNVKLEPWEMPYGWERGTASLKVVEPDTQVRCVVAAWGWTPGTKGKVTGPVVVLKVTTRADLDKYKGKLKNAIIMTAEPAKVAPVTDLNYGPLPPPKKAEPKAEPKEEKKATLGAVFAQVQPEKKKEVQPEKKEVQPEKKEEQPKRSTLTEDVEAFLVAEGAACRLQDSGKPHGLLAVSGNWKGTDRVPSPNIMPRLTVAHEYYAMLWRLANRPEPAVTRVEVEIS
ncbi:MAG TPA: peptidase M28, partial [Urbifossiella sp.]|nr:peptidase M28 [Urbifossiella sp.]